jgi:hypothetical protein
MALTAVSRGSAPTSAATAAAGFRYRQDSSITVRMASRPASAPGAPASCGGPAGGLGHHLGRLERRFAPIHPVRELSGTDEDRRAGIDHRSLPGAATAT